MKKTFLKLTVISTLGIASPHLFAAGTLCALPAAPTGSAYINAYNDGRVIPPLAGPPTTVLLARTNFSNTSDGGTAGSCEITALANDSVAPATGYGIFAVVSATRTIPSVTGGGTGIGQVVERIWRKPAATAPVTPTPMCILGTKISVLSNTDHDSGTAGIQFFEVDDIARGGYSSSVTVGVGYFKQAANASRLYRVGRAYTSVQHRAYNYFGTLAEQQNNGNGYLDLPTIGGLSTLNINGLNNGSSGFVNGVASIAPATLQEAQINSNWVDFTTKSYFIKASKTLGGAPSTSAVSAMTYIEFPCNNDSAATINATWVKAGAISLRQTGQDYSTNYYSGSSAYYKGDPSFKEITIPGYAPPGAVVP